MKPTSFPLLERDQILWSVIIETFHHGGVDQALKQAESLGSPSARLTAITSMAYGVTAKSPTK